MGRDRHRAVGRDRHGAASTLELSGRPARPTEMVAQDPTGSEREASSDGSEPSAHGHCRGPGLAAWKGRREAEGHPRSAPGGGIGPGVASGVRGVANRDAGRAGGASIGVRGVRGVAKSPLYSVSIQEGEGGCVPGSEAIDARGTRQIKSGKVRPHAPHTPLPLPGRLTRHPARRARRKGSKQDDN